MLQASGGLWGVVVLSCSFLPSFFSTCVTWVLCMPWHLEQGAGCASLHCSYHGEAVALILRLHAIEVVKVNKPVILLSCSCFFPSWSKSSHELNVFIIQTENKLKIYYNDKLFPEVKQLIYVHCLFFCSMGILGW